MQQDRCCIAQLSRKGSAGAWRVKPHRVRCHRSVSASPKEPSPWSPPLRAKRGEDSRGNQMLRLVNALLVRRKRPITPEERLRQARLAPECYGATGSEHRKRTDALVGDVRLRIADRVEACSCSDRTLGCGRSRLSV